MRRPSTDRQGNHFDSFTIAYIWTKSTPIDGYDARIWRRDSYGHAMKFGEYGNCNSEYGWEIDHIFPVARGGSDELSNLQPLYWQNNRKKSDSIVAA